MKPKALHNEAMDLSFRAKKALEEGKHLVANELFEKAADLESQVAEFYFDKPEFEPTRSILVRSAAFVNLKSGNIERAKKFIFFGLLNTQDPLIKEQLNDALELAMSLNYEVESPSKDLSYLKLLRQRSVHYVLEPSNHEFGSSVSLESIKEFSDHYLRSLKAYAQAKFRRLSFYDDDYEIKSNETLKKIINPLVTSSAYGSFKFSIANDYVDRTGEPKELQELKANIIPDFHGEVFTNPLTDKGIDKIKEEYTEVEVNNIFKPIIKIKSNTTPYKVGYFDSENFSKNFADRIVNQQRKKLLKINKIQQSDIGQLESLIVHKRSSGPGKTTSKTLLKKELKSYEFDIETNEIPSIDNPAVLLSEEIVINVQFDSENGFRFYFDDFRVEFTDIEYENGLKQFYQLFYNKIVSLANVENRKQEEEQDWNYIKGLIGNPSSFILNKA